jgi:hypothetical protein
MYIILTAAGHAYQRGSHAAIVSCANWKWATKFETPEKAIEEMNKVVRTRYRVVEYPGCTKIVAANGELLAKSYDQLPPVQSFFR